MNPIALIPTVLSNNLAVAVVGICLIFFVAVVLARLVRTSHGSEETSNGISWSKDGRINRRQQRVK